MSLIPTIFNFNGKKVRTLIRKSDNSHWYSIKDIAALFNKTIREIRSHCLDPINQDPNLFIGFKENKIPDRVSIKVVSEADLYRIILNEEYTSVSIWIIEDLIKKSKQVAIFGNKKNKRNKKIESENNDTSESLTIGNWAKLISTANMPISQNDVFNFLRINKYVQRGRNQQERNVPYQKYINNDYFECRILRDQFTVLVTKRGRAQLSGDIIEYISKQHQE